MPKKIFIILCLVVLSVSCGKKSDPVYQQKSGLNNWKINGSSVIYKK